MILCIFEHVIYFFTIIFVSEHTEHLYFNVESLRVSMFVNKETTYLLTYSIGVRGYVLYNSNIHDFNNNIQKKQYYKKVKIS